MHEAYKYHTILWNLPLPIECIACWSEDQAQPQTYETPNRNSSSSIPNTTLLVGTKAGHLLVYTITLGGNSRPDVTLLRSNRTFSKKPILQLFVCAELDLIISLSDSVVSIHNLTTFQLVSIIQKSRGATSFSADLECKTSSQGENAYSLRLCIAVKRKLQIYFWNRGNFDELTRDINLLEVPKCMAWCRDSICLGFKKDYFIVSTRPKALPKELFSTGKLMEPVMSKFDDNKLILVKDDISVFVNNAGVSDAEVFKWSDNPVAIETQLPYVLAILPSYVEVRTIEPRMQIQNFDFPKAKFITKLKDWIFIASTNNVWGIVQNPASLQIEQLLRNKQFELALSLAQNINDLEQNKDDIVKQIQNSLAFELFCQSRFKESLQNFANLGTDPAQVIGLYPNLLPTNFMKNLRYPSDLPPLRGIKFEEGLSALIEYLTGKRNEVLSTKRDLPKGISIVEGNRVIKTRDSLHQIIDTTLLKCYLHTNDALIAPLLRLPDNHCHVEECEKVLKDANKQAELIILYRRKNLHRKALKLLLEVKAGRKDKLQDDIVEYLQHLGPEHIVLIFEFAVGVLKQNEDDGLRIFTDDIPEVESLPKKRVYDFLKEQSTDLGMKYLVHLVYSTGDTTPEFHDNLVIYYCDKAKALINLHQDELPEVDKYSATSGPEELVELRSKLLCFLKTSTHYRAGMLLEYFKDTNLIEEYAILLGRDGQHEKALGIYAQKLRQPEKAEEYCQEIFDRDNELANDIFLSLFKMYLHPEMEEQEENGIKPDFDAAFRVLREHAKWINSIEAVSILPDDTDVSKISEFLQIVMEKLKESRRETDILEKLMLGEKYLAHKDRIRQENRRYEITDDDLCFVCQKRIGDSAFVCYPGGEIVHYYCSKDKKASPTSRN